MVGRILDEQVSSGMDLESAEMAIRSSVHKVGALALEKIINAESSHCGTQIKCKSGHEAQFVNYREKKLLTVLGEIRAKRAYYHCQECQYGIIPKDGSLDIEKTGFSPGVRRMMALVGAKESFDAGHSDLKILAGIAVSAKDVERIAEAIGDQIEFAAKKERQIATESNVVVLLPAIENLYIAMDGTGVPVVKRETSGRKGKDASGIAKTREAKLGVFFTQTGFDKEGHPVRDEHTTSYTGGIETCEEFGKRIYAEAIRRGVSRAKRTTILADGALWIWNLAEELFPNATQILDFYHAAEYLAELAKSIHANSQVIRDLWLDTQRKELHDGDVENVIDAMKRIESDNETAKEQLRKTIGYFETNRKRMQYAQFIKQGLFIGSGVIEAGCKTIVGQRLKQSGMHWTVKGANSIIALRCCQISGQWEDYWESRRAA